MPDKDKYTLTEIRNLFSCGIAKYARWGNSPCFYEARSDGEMIGHYGTPGNRYCEVIDIAKLVKSREVTIITEIPDEYRAY